jgi:hypothetical protein
VIGPTPGTFKSRVDDHDPTRARPVSATPARSDAASATARTRSFKQVKNRGARVRARGGRRAGQFQRARRPVASVAAKPCNRLDVPVQARQRIFSAALIFRTPPELTARFNEMRQLKQKLRDKT